MGTTYSVKFFQRFPWLKSDLKPLIESRLSELVLIFSTYEKDSLVSDLIVLGESDLFLLMKILVIY